MLGLAPLLAEENPPACQAPTIVANVRDKQGNLVPALQPESFRVKLGDESVSVKSVATGTGTHRIVLLVDISGSINKSEHTWEVARVVAGNLLVAAPSTLRVALVLFSDHIIDTIGFDRPASDIVERLAKLETGKGRTALLDSLAYAANLLGSPVAGDSVYVISDGGENASHAHRSDVENRLLATGVRLFAFVVRPQYPLPTPEEAAEAALLPEVTSMTGGGIIDAAPAVSLTEGSGLRPALSRLYDRIARFYQLQLTVPQRWAKKKRLRLEVVDESGRNRKDLSLSYPEYLLPCPH